MSPLLILYRYISREFLKWLGVVFSSFFTLIFIFDLIEWLRRAAAQKFSFGAAVHIVLLKTPHLLTQLLPFVVLLTTIIVFWRFIRGREFLVMRTLGLSIWQVLMPVILLMVSLKVMELFFVQPFVSTLYRRFERLEKHYTHQDTPHHIALSENGLWIRHGDPAGHFILHAKRIDNEKLQEVSIFQLHNKGGFLRRLEAREARLEPGSLTLRDVRIFDGEMQQVKVPVYRFPSSLSFEKIQASSAHPDTLSFWRIPGLINLLEQSQLSTYRYWLKWHTMIAQVFLALSMVLLGAGSIFFHLGRKKVFYPLILSAGIGFSMFLMSDVTQALGLAGDLPVIVAAWAPVLISFLMGYMMILHAEDQ